MFKKAFILVGVALFLFSCQSGKEDAQKFSADYTKIIQELKEERANVKSRDQYVAYKEERKKEFEALLAKYQESPGIDEIEILRAKVLLGLENLDEAEAKIDKLLGKDPDLVNEAKLIKVKILIEKKEYDEAHHIFKEIEPGITDQQELFNVYFSLGQEHKDNKIREAYSRKVIAAGNMPEDFVKRKWEMYSNLAAIACQREDYDQARELLKEGIAKTGDERKRILLEKQMGQIDLIGKSAFPIPAKTWLNSAPLQLAKLRGKTVLIFYWAPWCPYCRELQPLLIDEYQQNMDQGLAVIGFTRLYGNYRDDQDNKGKVSNEEEIELIKKYLERKKVSYPIAVAEDKSVFDRYSISGLPTLVFIDKKGNIDFFKIGSGDEQFIKERIKSLLTVI